MAFRLQIRGPGPARSVLSSLSADSSAADLVAAVSQASGIKPDQLRLLGGFPPAQIDLSDLQASLLSLGIKSGDSFMVESGTSQRGIVQAEASKEPTIFSIPKNQGLFCRRAMPMDNSCLFHSVAYVCNDRQRDAATKMRQLVADTVASDPKYFNSTLLEQSNASYRQWIMNPNVWGGAIELQIFARHFQTEIIAFDPEYLREDIYGQDFNFSRRAFVLFTTSTSDNGQHSAHYDALVFQPSSGSGESMDKVLFNSKDHYAWERARQFIESMHKDAVAKNSQLKLCKQWRRTKSGDVPAPSVGRNLVSPKSKSDSPCPVQPSTSQWSCPGCTFINASKNTQCEMCGTQNN